MNKLSPLLVFGFLLLVGCAAPAATPSRAALPTPTSAPTPTPVDQTTYLPAAPVTWNEIIAVMESAEITESYTTRFGAQRLPSPGQKFLWVHVRLENLGKNEIKLPAPEHFSVLYADSELKPTYGHRQDYLDYTSLTTPLYPSQFIDAWLRFDIPATAELGTLRFVFLPESAQVGVRPVAPTYPWGGEHPIFVWKLQAQK